MKTLLFAPMLLSVALGRTLNLNVAEKAPAPERRPLAHYLDKISSKDGLTHIDIPCSTGETVGCFKQLCETSRAATPDFDCGRIFSNSPSLDGAPDDRSHGTKPHGKVRLDQCEPWNPELDDKCFNQLCKVVDARWPHQHMCALGHHQHKTTPSHDSSYKGRPVPHKAKDYKRSVSDEDISESESEELVEPDTDVETDTTVEPVTIVHPPTVHVQPATVKPAGVQPVTTRPGRDPLRSMSLSRLERKIKKQYSLVKKLRKQFRKVTGNEAGKNHSGQLARAEKKYLRLEYLRKKKMGYLESKMKLKIEAQKKKSNSKAKSKLQRLKLGRKKKPKKADPKEDVEVEEVAEAKEEPADKKDSKKPKKGSKKTSKKPKKSETESPKKQPKKEKTDKKTPSTADEKGNVALNLKIECTHDCDKRSDIVLAENEFQDQTMTIPQVSETVSEEKKAEEKDSKKEKRDLDQEAPSAKTETPIPGHQELDWRVKVDDAPAPTPVPGYQELDWQVKTKPDVPTTITTTTSTVTTTTTSTPTLTSQLPNPPKPPRPAVPKGSKPWFKAQSFADNGMAKTVQKRGRGPGIPCPKNDRRECLKKEREAEERMYNLPGRR